jgi:hypothetical protein
MTTLIHVRQVLCAETMQQRWIGPRTRASPDGFLFSKELMNALTTGLDLLLIFKLAFADLRRLAKELEETSGIWALDKDYGSYSGSVCCNRMCYWNVLSVS